jgi:hypothetical protein
MRTNTQAGQTRNSTRRNRKRTLGPTKISVVPGSSILNALAITLVPTGPSTGVDVISRQPMELEHLLCEHSKLSKSAGSSASSSESSVCFKLPNQQSSTLGTAAPRHPIKEVNAVMEEDQYPLTNISVQKGVGRATRVSFGFPYAVISPAGSPSTNCRLVNTADPDSPRLTLFTDKARQAQKIHMREGRAFRIQNTIHLEQ